MCEMRLQKRGALSQVWAPNCQLWVHSNFEQPEPDIIVDPESPYP